MLYHSINVFLLPSNLIIEEAVHATNHRVTARHYSPPVPSPFALSFLLTIFTPLSNALLLRGGGARRTAGVGSDGDEGSGTRGSGGLILGEGAALTVGCVVPGFAGSDGCAGTVG